MISVGINSNQYNVSESIVNHPNIYYKLVVKTNIGGLRHCFTNLLGSITLIYKHTCGKSQCSIRKSSINGPFPCIFHIYVRLRVSQSTKNIVLNQGFSPIGDLQISGRWDGRAAGAEPMGWIPSRNHRHPMTIEMMHK